MGRGGSGEGICGGMMLPSHASTVWSLATAWMASHYYWRLWREVAMATLWRPSNLRLLRSFACWPAPFFPYRGKDKIEIV